MQYARKLQERQVWIRGNTYSLDLLPYIPYIRDMGGYYSRRALARPIGPRTPRLIASRACIPYGTRGAGYLLECLHGGNHEVNYYA